MPTAKSVLWPNIGNADLPRWKYSKRLFAGSGIWPDRTLARKTPCWLATCDARRSTCATLSFWMATYLGGCGQEVILDMSAVAHSIYVRHRFWLLFCSSGFPQDLQLLIRLKETAFVLDDALYPLYERRRLDTRRPDHETCRDCGRATRQ